MNRENPLGAIAVELPNLEKMAGSDQQDQADVADQVVKAVAHVLLGNISFSIFARKLECSSQAIYGELVVMR